MFRAIIYKNVNENFGVSDVLTSGKDFFSFFYFCSGVPAYFD